MSKELVINSNADKIEIALLEDKKLVELHHEDSSSSYKVGDVCLGRVKKLMPNLNAAFVDVGYGQDAFLHYSDMSPYFRTVLDYTHKSQALKGKDKLKIQNVKMRDEIIKTDKITNVIKGRPYIMVQILKEPINSKGPRVSCELSFPGRYVVLTPFNDGISVSKKIYDKAERARLKKIISHVKVPQMGVIIRTVAEGVSAQELHDDLNRMMAKWESIQKNLKGNKKPSLVFTESNKTTSLLRDFLNDDFSAITTNDKKLESEVKGYLQKVSPEYMSRIKQINVNGTPLFDKFGITKQIKGLFGRQVFMRSGSSLIIEHTEACHVIDVNSGNRKREKNQEENALQTNLEAVQEIARQLRLRDLGGIIVIDFIDMRQRDNRQRVYKELKNALKKDRARSTVLPISKFGLIQITRQRLKPSLKIKTEDNCPSCQGTGKVQPGILIADNIDQQLENLKAKGYQNIQLVVNPIIHAYLTKGSFFKKSLGKKWKTKYKMKLDIQQDQNFPLLDYAFMDRHTHEKIQLEG